MASHLAVLAITGVVFRAIMVVISVILVGMVVFLGLFSVVDFRVVGRTVLVALGVVAAKEMVVEMVADMWVLVMCPSMVTIHTRVKHQWFWVLHRA